MVFRGSSRGEAADTPVINKIYWVNDTSPPQATFCNSVYCLPPHTLTQCNLDPNLDFHCQFAPSVNISR